MKMLKIKGDVTLQHLYMHVAVFNLYAVLSASAICKYLCYFSLVQMLSVTFGKLSIRPAT